MSRIFTPLVTIAAVLFAQSSMIVVLAFYLLFSLSVGGCPSLFSICHHKEDFVECIVIQAIPSKIWCASVTNSPRYGPNENVACLDCGCGCEVCEWVLADCVVRWWVCKSSAHVLYVHASQISVL